MAIPEMPADKNGIKIPSIPGPSSGKVVFNSASNFDLTDCQIKISGYDARPEPDPQPTSAVEIWQSVQTRRLSQGHYHYPEKAKLCSPEDCSCPIDQWHGGYSLHSRSRT